MFSSIAILGPGLLGGSLAMAIRERMPGTKIRIWARRVESVRKVLDRGISDAASTDAPQIAEGADLILFCMPIGAMKGVAEQIVDAVQPDALVTDVGSVKALVMETLGEIFRGHATFIGSHPMAGSEQAGIEAARPDLFERAITILTPGVEVMPEKIEALAQFWESLGCRVASASPRAHDEAVALISHLPHLTAAALVRTAMEENPASLEWIGNGFLDTTRVASGPAEMWAEILLENRAALQKAIHAMIENLSEASKLLDAGATGAIEDYLDQARLARNRLKQEPLS